MNVLLGGADPKESGSSNGGPWWLCFLCPHVPPPASGGGLAVALSLDVKSKSEGDGTGGDTEDGLGLTSGSLSSI